MKTLVTIVAAVMLAMSASIADAQNAPTASPNAINKSNLPNNKSGNESQATAKKGDKNATKNMLEKEKQQTSGANPSSK